MKDYLIETTNRHRQSVDFIKNMSAEFDLNQMNSVTGASFLWECALKITKMELESLTNVDMMLHYKNGIRGRIKNYFSL